MDTVLALVDETLRVGGRMMKRLLAQMRTGAFAVKFFAIMVFMVALVSSGIVPFSVHGLWLSAALLLHGGASYWQGLKEGMGT